MASLPHLVPRKDFISLDVLFAFALPPAFPSSGCHTATEINVKAAAQKMPNKFTESSN
jgi:hypothetical protein